METHHLALEIAHAYASRSMIAPLSSRGTDVDLDRAYEIQTELVRMRRAEGHRTVGVKVGYANKAVWRVMKLSTVVWGQMYDDTVRAARGGAADLPLARMIQPKIEPEIVFKLSRPLGTEPLASPRTAEEILGFVEWIALGFEIIDCPFPDWKFHPVDFVAAYGVHAGLVYSEPLAVTTANIPHLVDELATFTVRLSKDGALVAEGSGKNVLKSPALSLAELDQAIAHRSGAEPLAAGALVSSGTLTDSKLIAPGDTWRADVDGIALAPATVVCV
ncbi:MAG: fumarylacetoacetate hydrolase family protein [Acidobacteriaceae bacterium]|jgi:2-oxo-3-hexenedioate decarboxylase|nr:fumarylacetoacetate hydrolase family protein [Acidobacteriaceae bacterium]